MRVFVPRGLPVPVGGERADVQSLFPLFIENPADVFRRILRMTFIQDALHRNADTCSAARVFIGVDRLLSKRYKAYPACDEPLLKIIALIRVVSEATRQIRLLSVFGMLSYRFFGLAMRCSLSAVS